MKEEEKVLTHETHIYCSAKACVECVSNVPDAVTSQINHTLSFLQVLRLKEA